MNILKIIPIILLCGCAQIQDKRIEYQDMKLDAAEMATCETATVGAVIRKYGDNPDRWRDFCTKQVVP